MAPQRIIGPIGPKLSHRTVFVCAVLLLSTLGCSGQSSLDGNDSGAAEFRLLTSSMAPQYWGTRYPAQCVNCGHDSAIPAEAVEDGWPVRCQKCGGTCSLADSPLPGSSVSIHQANRPLTRFDVVAINQTAGPPLLKRVWGLPGEQLEIGSGELWIDGAMLQKSLPELRSVAIPLDAQWSQAPLSTELSGGTQRESFQWQCEIPAPVHTSDSPPSDWLAPAPISDAAPIPLLAGVPPLASPDILLRFEIQSPAPEIVVDYTYFGTPYRVALNVSIETSGYAVLLERQAAAERTIDIAFCDRQLLLSADKQVFAPESLAEIEASAEWGDQQSAISITATKGAVRGISLYRDIILRSMRRAPSEREQYARLASGEYFVLGDNQPHSSDSRGPTLATIKHKHIVGIIQASQTSSLQSK